MAIKRTPNMMGGEDISIRDAGVFLFIVVTPRQSGGKTFFSVTVYDGDREEHYLFQKEGDKEEFISSLVS